MHRAGLQKTTASSSSSPQKFRKMTWLEAASRSASTATQPLSPEKAMVLHRSRPKGVKAFKQEKHSRFSSIGSHVLTVRFVDHAGLNHEEIRHALDLPSHKAISVKPEVRLGGVTERFEGPDTHFVAMSGMAVASCGLSHEEEKRAREMPERKAVSTKADAGLGGLEHRFEGPNTHFTKAQGADMMLGQPQLSDAGLPVSIPKNNWLKNLWAVSGTAMEDREMRECDAVVAPKLPVHQDFQPQGAVVAKMNSESGPRFTYQKPSTAASLGGYISQESQWKAKGNVVMRTEKHSRFSTFGSHYYKKN